MAMADALRDGRFVLLEPLGAGAQGQTFAGVDKREGLAVAIKRFDVRGARTWKDAELAEREAHVLQSLSHPKLPRYIDHFEHEGALYLVMERIEGESLASLRRRGVVFSEADAIRLLSDAGQVLEYLHSRSPPVIHRDLKPGNVLRRPDGSFAFVDFGSVRDKLRPEGGSTVVGTFGYMAPEQFQGRAFPATDAYGIGATALCMVTGREPEALPHKGLAIDVRAALRGLPSERLVPLLERLLEPDPDRRAARIAPLLSQFAKGGRSSAGHGARPRTPAGDQDDRPEYDARSPFERQAQDFERRAEEFERRALEGPGARGWRRGAVRYLKAAEKMREAARHHEAAAARREGHRASRRARYVARQNAANARPPWPIRVLIRVLFAIGMLAVLVATQVIVPLVLRVLALFFARRSLGAAVGAVRHAGQDAVREMTRSRQWFAGSGRDEPPRVSEDRADAPEAPVRISDDGTRTRVDAQSEDDEAEEEWGPSDAGKRRL